jgi:hypothetical protein
VGFAPPAVVDEAEALALRVLEIQRQAAVPLGDLGVRDAAFAEALLPPGERLRSGDPQRCPRDRVCAAPLGRDGPVEESDVRAGARQPVRVEEVIGADIVLVHRLLDEAHAKHALIESSVSRRVGRNGRQVVNAIELHGNSALRRSASGIGAVRANLVAHRQECSLAKLAALLTIRSPVKDEGGGPRRDYPKVQFAGYRPFATVAAGEAMPPGGVHGSGAGADALSLGARRA